MSDEMTDTRQRKADPDCPDCGGTGIATIHRSLMDRVDEFSVPCPRCTAAETERPPSEQADGQG
jgi:DnaJ-class molecular chaperone